MKTDWNKSDTLCLKCIETEGRQRAKSAMERGDFTIITYTHNNSTEPLQHVLAKVGMLASVMPSIRIHSVDDCTIAFAVTAESVIDIVLTPIVSEVNPALQMARADNG